MRTGGVRIAFVVGVVSWMIVANLAPGNAFHLYRSDDGGCSAADGALSDDPVGTVPNVTASVALGHNVFSEGLLGTGLSVETLLTPTETHIKAGESITWAWNSAHCHSVTSADFASGTTRLFDSGFHYPTTPPESPRVIPGFLEYPILDSTPTLTYTHTFPSPGTFAYFCVHHASIGMRGVVIVDQ